MLPDDWLVTLPGVRDIDAAHQSVLAAWRDGDAELDEAFRRALGGQWHAYALRLRELGSHWAHSPTPVERWRELVDRRDDAICRRLIELFAAEPQRLSEAAAAMMRVRDASLTAFMSAVHERQQRSDTLLQMSRIAHVLVDDSGRLLQSNPAFMTLYGLTEDTLASKTLASLFASSEAPRVWRDHYAEASAAGWASYDSVHRRADGSEFPVHVEAVRLPSADGHGSVWAHGMYDLTERKQMEELRSQQRDLVAENERVRAADRLKSEFLHYVSHELRTPLNAVLGFAELLTDGVAGELAEPQLDFVREIHRSGSHLLELINEVLDLAKVESGKLVLTPSRFELRALADEVVGSLAALAAKFDVEVLVELEEPLPSVHLDRRRTIQVLYNFLSNAMKHSPRRGQVTLVVSREGDGRVMLAVHDQGRGITPEDQQRLFLPFEQLRATLPDVKGTGLGLALTRRLVEAMGGEVGCASNVRGGATFYAVLPTAHG